MIFQKLTDFTLNAYYPNVPTLHTSVETNLHLENIFHDFPAKVPGCVHNDLLRAGMIRDPYYELQSMEAEWVSARWWIYTTTFHVEHSMEQKHLRLRLNGIDYKAQIFLNGQKTGEHTGMYVPYVQDITELVQYGADNTLSVLLEQAPDEMGQIGYTERTLTQKARFPYKWDFSTRLIQLGLYDEAWIECFEETAIEYAQLVPVAKTSDLKSWELQCNWDLHAFCDAEAEAEIHLSFQGQEIVSQKKSMTLTAGNNQLSAVLPVENPELWWPNGHGGQPLYDLTLTLNGQHGVSDQKSWSVGFRTLSYARCDGAGEDALTYIPVINNKRIYIKGSNLVPLDIMYGTVTEERYRRMAELVADANINLLRVWGGGLIERESFYNWCDRLGIMVWQEMIQSSSGISNVPSKQEPFLRLLTRSAEEAARVKRNHVCLTFWSGGNELFSDQGGPVDYTDPNIAMLKAIFAQHDPQRLMLPSSPSGPNDCWHFDQQGSNHDIHGPWKYEGIERHYWAYNNSDSMLHSEFGVDGMTNYTSLCTFTEPINRQVCSMKDNVVWRHHGEWWDTLKRDSDIFGCFEPQDIHDFIMCSQFIQGEGLRYALEANRRRAFQNGGSINWQFNEPWPNVSGTNIVDYYLNGKLAYHMVRDAFRTVNPCLKYHKLVYRPEEKCRIEAYICNDGAACQDKLICEAKDSAGRIVWEGQYDVNIPENGACFVTDAEWDIPAGCDSVTVVLRLLSTGTESRYLLLVAAENEHADKQAVARFLKEYHNR